MQQTHLHNFLIIIVVLISGGVYFLLRVPGEPTNIESDSSVSPNEVEKLNDSLVDQYFLQHFAEKIPPDYNVSDGLYFPNPREEPRISSTVVIPCAVIAPTGAVPILCYTRLEYWKSEAYTMNIDTFLTEEEHFSGYEERYSEKFVRKITDRGTLVYTPKYFNCFGTGAETCLQKQFVFFYQDGSVGRAWITFFPYDKNDDRLDQVTPEVQDVLDIYEEILLSL